MAYERGGEFLLLPTIQPVFTARSLPRSSTDPTGQVGPSLRESPLKAKALSRRKREGPRRRERDQQDVGRQGAARSVSQPVHVDSPSTAKDHLPNGQSTPMLREPQSPVSGPPAPPVSMDVSNAIKHDPRVLEIVHLRASMHPTRRQRRTREHGVSGSIQHRQSR